MILVLRLAVFCVFFILWAYDAAAYTSMNTEIFKFKSCKSYASSISIEVTGADLKGDNSKVVAFDKKGILMHTSSPYYVLLYKDIHRIFADDEGLHVQYGFNPGERFEKTITGMDAFCTMKVKAFMGSIRSGDF